MPHVSERLVLAGPIVRRVERERVHIWIATSRPTEVTARIFDISEGSEEIGNGSAESIQLGPHLHIHLITATPTESLFPSNRLLGYDLTFRSGDQTLTLDDVGLPGGLAALTYEGIPLPSFFISSGETDLRVLHGSCRLLHGRGPDALALADQALQAAPQDLEKRPCALFLTGDQIYGDDVADALITHLTQLGSALADDDDSMPGVGRLSDIAVGERKGLMTEQAHFTSQAGENHLMSFGEFAATYIVAWNEANWPDNFPPPRALASQANPLKSIAGRVRYRADVKALEQARAALRNVRRVLANTPSYMIFDDHDVTDDWNLTRKWRKEVEGSPLGKRIVSNALLAYWAFQGWGNDPVTQDRLRDRIVDARSDHERMDEMMWSYEDWSYTAPVTPPVLVTNTRTQRTYDSAEGGARLIGERELGRMKTLIESAGYEAGDPLVLISATPVFALEMAERRQKFLRGKVGPYEIDLEAWHDNLCGLMDLMNFLMNELRSDRVFILSGDVHYGMTMKVRFTIGERSLDVGQFVSSSLKHGGKLSKQVLDGLGRLLLQDHRRVGWEHPPPELKTSSNLRGRIAQRAANTDEWNEEAPVLLSPKMAKLLRISTEPTIDEQRTYVETRGAKKVRLVGEHNIGLVTISRNGARQELLYREKSDLDVMVTEIVLDGTGV